VISDHADWQGLLQSVKATGAERIFCTHGYTEIFARFLREQGLEAHSVRTQYLGETADPEPAAAEESEP
jgi:putative mRNA 3-end processing factor